MRGKIVPLQYSKVNSAVRKSWNLPKEQVNMFLTNEMLHYKTLFASFENRKCYKGDCVTPFMFLDFEYANMFHKTQHIFLETENLYHFLTETNVVKNNNFCHLLNDVIKEPLKKEDYHKYPSVRYLTEGIDFHGYAKQNNLAIRENALSTGKVNPFCNVDDIVVKQSSGWIHVPNIQYSVGFTIRVIFSKTTGEPIGLDSDAASSATSNFIDWGTENISHDDKNSIYTYSVANNLFVCQPCDPTRSNFLAQPLFTKSVEYLNEKGQTDQDPLQVHMRSLKRLVLNMMYYIHAFPDLFKNGTPDNCIAIFENDHMYHPFKLKSAKDIVDTYIPISKRGTGEGSSKSMHFRSGHWRTLRNERFKRDGDNHYKTIWINPIIVKRNAQVKLLLEKSKNHEKN